MRQQRRRRHASASRGACRKSLTAMCRHRCSSTHHHPMTNSGSLNARSADLGSCAHIGVACQSPAEHRNNDATCAYFSALNPDSQIAKPALSCAQSCVRCPRKPWPKSWGGLPKLNQLQLATRHNICAPARKAIDCATVASLISCTAMAADELRSNGHNTQTVYSGDAAPFL